MSTTSRSGFTLIELLLVIGIIAILVSIVIVAINPAKSIGEARDAQRRQDVHTILNAVYDYLLDNDGTLPAGIPVAAPKVICQSDVAPADCAAKYNGVSLRVLSGSHLSLVPRDPLVSYTGTGTRYTIMQDANDRIVVTAPGAERAEKIEAMR